MPPFRRRRRSTPTPAEIWRILHATAQEAKIARRKLAELELRLALQAAEDAARREKERAELEAKYRAAQEEREKQREQDRVEREKAAAELEAKYRAAQEERDRQQAEHERQRAEHERQWAEHDRQWAERQKAREKAEAERDRQLERELHRILGDGDNRWGALIEGLVQGNIKKIFQNAGLDVNDAVARRRSRRHGVWREYDLVAPGKDDVVVVEVKSTLREADVPKFLSRLADFREWRPDDARPRVFGAFAYLTSEANAVELAETAGLYRVQAISGSARLVNSADFQPRIF